MAISDIPFIYLAPLQGLTHLPFRRAFFRTFPDVVDVAISPFISLTHGDLSNSLKKLSDVLPEANENSLKVIPQILGKEPDQFIQLANSLYNLGYDEINWNLGCPVDRVVRKKRGSGLLPYPEEIERILNIVSERIKNKLSIKMRLGFSSPDEIFKLLPVFNNHPLSFICIHPRIGIQMYDGNLFFESFSSCLSTLKHKVIFNGNICTVEDYDNIKKIYPDVQDFMLGRGLLKNPLLAGRLKNIRYSEPLSLFEKFEQNLFEEILSLPSVEKNKLNKMKEYWSYFSLSFSESDKILKDITTVQSLLEYKKVVRRVFGNFDLLKT